MTVLDLLSDMPQSYKYLSTLSEIHNESLYSYDELRSIYVVKLKIWVTERHSNWIAETLKNQFPLPSDYLDGIWRQAELIYSKFQKYLSESAKSEFDYFNGIVKDVIRELYNEEQL